MNSAVDYVKALKRPFSDTKSLIIGTLLGIIPLVNFTVIGYTLTSTGLSKEHPGKDTLPEWNDYVNLFLKGLKSVLIGITLFLPAALVIFATVGSVILSPALSMILGGVPVDSWDDLAAGNFSDIEMQHWLSQNWEEFIPLITNAAPFLILGVVLGFVAFYLMPVALLGWLKEDKMSAAFSMDTLKKAISLDYLVNWLIVGYLIGLLNSLLQWLPIIGAGITMYVGGVFSYMVFAQIYERAEN